MTALIGGRLAAAVFAALMLSAGVAAAQLMMTGVGQPMNGGSCADPNWSSVVLLVGNDNAANGTTTYTDQSGKHHSVTAGVGTPVYSNTTAPTGMTTSIRFPNTSNDYLQTANSTDWQLGSGNFTIELFFNPDNFSQAVELVTTVDGGSTDEFDVSLRAVQAVQVSASSNGSSYDIISSVNTSNTTSATTWVHYAFYRVGNNFYSALGGTVTNLGTSSSSLFGTTDPLTIGGPFHSGVINAFQGYAASVRVTKGIARYGSSNFTPPSLPLPHC